MKVSTQVSTKLFTLTIFSSFLLVQCGGSGGGSGTTNSGSKSSTPVAKVGSSVITEADLEIAASVNPRLKQRLATPAGKEKTVEQYVEQELVYQESLKKGYDKSPEVIGKMEFYKKLLVAEALLDEETGKKSKDYYANHRDEFERVRVSHIFIRVGGKEEEKKDPKNAIKLSRKEPKDKKEDASKSSTHSNEEALKLINDIKERLKKGEDFATLAKEISEDPMTKANGGDMGPIVIADNRLKNLKWLPVAEKAFVMKVGEISDPIKTEDGYHLVKVTEEKKLVPFEEVEAGIRFKNQADVRTQLVAQLKKDYKVEILLPKVETPANQPAAGAGLPPTSMPTVPTTPAAPAAPAGSAPTQPTH